MNAAARRPYTGRPHPARWLARHRATALAAIACIAVAGRCLGLGDWRPIGPDGGSVQALAFAPSDARAVYAGTAGAGVWRSSDGGMSWGAANRGLEHATVLALVVDRHDAGHLYAGTADGHVFSSADGGRTWRPASGVAGGHGLGVLPAGSAVNGLALHPSDSLTVYAATSGGLFRTDDAGWRWAAIDPDGHPRLSLSVAVGPADGSSLWLGTDSGLFHSEDGGGSWQEPTFEGRSFSPATAIALQPSDPHVVFAASYCNWCGESAFPIYVLMRSLDGGATWSAFYEPAGGQPIVSIALEPHDAARVYAGTPSALSASEDGGTTWTSAGLLAGGAMAVAADPAVAGRVLIASFGGVLASTDAGSTWSAAYEGLGNFGVAALAMGGTEPPTLYAAGGPAVLAARDVSTGHWAAANDGLLGLLEYGTSPAGVASLLAVPGPPATLLAGIGNGGAFRSVDGGRHWTAARTGLENESNPGTYVTPWQMAVDPGDPSTIYAATNFGVFKTTDGGDHWQVSNNGLPSDRFIRRIAVDALDPTIVYCTNARGAYVSSDRGVTWRAILAAASGAWIDGVAIDPGRPGRLYAAASGDGFYRSDDHGTHWAKLPVPSAVGCLPLVPSGERCPYFGTVAVDPSRPGSVLIGTANGVWRSLDGGTTWSPLGTGASGLTVTAIAFDPGTGTTYAGTSTAGVLMLEVARPRRHLRAAPPGPRTSSARPVER